MLGGQGLRPQPHARGCPPAAGRCTWTLLLSFVSGEPSFPADPGFTGATGFLDFPLSWAGRGRGWSKARGQGARRAQEMAALFPAPHKLNGSGCGVTGVDLQGSHPGPEVGVHCQQAHEGQGVEPHTEADVQVGEAPS